ncbi:MAG: hypothetical protein ACJA01_003823 [Saprospiraceae bacterium]|jgi:hypothetical protein
MLKFDEFKKLDRLQILNMRYICGGGTATEDPDGDDYAHSGAGVNTDDVVSSGHVTRGGTASADPIE